MEDERLAEAQAIMKKALAPMKAVRKLWTCSGCSERIEGQFSECWNCGRERGDAAVTKAQSSAKSYRLT